MSTSVPFVDLSIVVPAYNEEHRLPPTLARLHALPRRPSRCATRSSSSTTARATRPAPSSRPRWRTSRTCASSARRPNRGKGAAVRLGMLAARGQIRVMSDADGSMSPEQLPRLLAPILACTRRDRDRLALRRGRAAATSSSRATASLWSRLANKVDPALAGPRRARHPVRLQGVHRRGGARAVRAAAGSTAGRSTSRSSRSRGAPATQIAEVGVEWTDDRRSRVNPLKDMWKVVREAMTIRKNLRRGVYSEPPARCRPRRSHCHAWRIRG